MSKHRHSKDKMHITYSEMKQDWEGKKDKKKLPFQKLPFYCCSLSLAPFDTPVCTTQGHVFDILNIMPFIKKYQRNPITGQPLKANQLIKMHWTKNQKNQYEDPISYKVFTEYTNIVCIRTSGYVYAFDTITELNKKPKFYFDLVTNQPFCNDDIIVIQDPKRQKDRQVSNFDYLKNNVPFVPPDKLEAGMGENQSINRIMDEVNGKRKAKEDLAQEEIRIKKKVRTQLEAREDVKGFISWCIENKVYKHERETDMRSASLTSTSFTPNIKAESNWRDLKESQVRDKIYKEVKKDKMKGFVQIMTNLGNINLLIHADMVPRTSQNFIQLTEAGYYDKTEFHRLVKDFCLQGGDPTGSGTGGQTIFGGGKPFSDEFHPKLLHNKAGVLSMANSGPNTNKSQFFILLAAAPHLDNKHSVFGQVISNETLLYNINKNYTSKSNKPKQPITIQKMFCYDNPFRKAIKKLKQALSSELTPQELKVKEKQRWIQDGTEKFKLPQSKKETKKMEGDTLKSKVLNNYF